MAPERCRIFRHATARVKQNESAWTVALVLQVFMKRKCMILGVCKHAAITMQ